MSRLQNCIEKLKIVKQEYQLTARESRYVDKQVRNQLKLIIPKSAKLLPEYLNPAEIYQLFEICKDNQDTRFLVEFQIATGLRIDETTNLLLDSFDWYNSVVKVLGKGNKERMIPLSQNMQHKIKMYVGERKKGYLFCKKNEKKYTKRALQYWIESALDKCKFNKKLSTHSLRHTFACLCLARGMPLEHIQVLMGHTKITTTQIYAKLELGNIKEKFMQLMGTI